MARLLAYTTPAPGNIYPSVPMLLELRARGHEVKAFTRPAEVERLRTAGLDAAPVDARIQAIEIDDWRARSQVGATMRLLRAFAARGQLEIDDLRRAVAKFEPDALIVDINAQGAGYFAETTGLPWAQYCPFPPALRSVDAPAYGLGLPPARGWPGKARDRFMRSLSDRLVAPQLRPLNQLRSSLGLAPLCKFDEQFLKADRLIVFTAEPYEYPRSDWPAHVRLVGPSEWGPPGAPPPWLASETRPIVLVTASTERQGDDKLIAAALKGLANDDFAVIATTGAQNPAAFDAPANARVERFLPHAPIIARAACVVSHGGQGTTQKALAAGVPVCVVPFCRDQFEVARRVEVAGAGVRLHHSRLSPRRLRAAVHSSLAKRPGARRVAETFAGAGGPPAAADAIEELPGVHEPEARLFVERVEL